MVDVCLGYALWLMSVMCGVICVFLECYLSQIGVMCSEIQFLLTSSLHEGFINEKKKV
jgi:hypothetical protein